MCQAKQKADRTNKSSKTGKPSKLHQLEDNDFDDEKKEENYVESSTTNGHLNICQLSEPNHKFIVEENVNGVSIDMEVDSGAERSTIPWTLFQNQLAASCNLVPTTVTLRQYDHTPLAVKGQCQVQVQVHDSRIQATFMAVDVST